VKSMGGERLEAAKLGWHGLDGDRRLAFRRMDDRSGMPWLTASKLPAVLLFAPHPREDGAQGDLPTHLRTPDGKEMPVFGEDLATEVGRRYGAQSPLYSLCDFHSSNASFKARCIGNTLADASVFVAFRCPPLRQ
jgi:hypothetical protein